MLIAAAGRGTRAGLPYPKTLFPISGQPILIHLLKLLKKLDGHPAVIVSPEGLDPIMAELTAWELSADLITQATPKGMGDAVLCIEHSEVEPKEHILLVWGDIPFIQQTTVTTLVSRHLQNSNDFTFATRVVDKAYTVVRRDAEGGVVSLHETRGTGRPLEKGERDIGLFIFRSAPVLAALKADLEGKLGNGTGEHGFLYIVKHLVNQGLKVEALPIASELDLVSLNSLSDVQNWVKKT